MDKRPQGRPEIEPTPEQREDVTIMMSAGLTQATIAKILKISIASLQKHYRHELDVGKEEAIQKITKNLFRIATGESKAAVTAACFYLKTQGGWRETDRNGGEQQIIINVNDGVTRNAQRISTDQCNNTDKPTT
jgi:hypothetical protein